MRRPGGQSTPSSAQKIIAITRPVGKGSDTAGFVRNLGWTPFIFHTVELKPLEAGKIGERIRNCFKQGPVDWVVFMSSTGTKLIFDSLDSGPTFQRFPETTRFLAVGPRTRETIERRVANEVHLPRTYSSIGVAEFFSRSPSNNLRVLLVRSASADDFLATSLKSLGMEVQTINVYESVVPKDPESAFDFLRGLSTQRFGAVLFTSAVSVSNLLKIAEMQIENAHVIDLLKRAYVGSIGPATAKELERLGIHPTQPDEYLIESAVWKLISESTQSSLTTVAK